MINHTFYAVWEIIQFFCGQKSWSLTLSDLDLDELPPNPKYLKYRLHSIHINPESQWITYMRWITMWLFLYPMSEKHCSHYRPSCKTHTDQKLGTKDLVSSTNGNDQIITISLLLGPHMQNRKKEKHKRMFFFPHGLWSAAHSVSCLWIQNRNGHKLTNVIHLQCLCWHQCDVCRQLLAGWHYLPSRGTLNKVEFKLYLVTSGSI